MTHASNISSNANQGLLGVYSTIAQPAAPYSSQPGQRKASRRRFAPVQRGGEGRKLVDGKHQHSRADARRTPPAQPLAAAGAAVLANRARSVASRPHSAPADLFSMADYRQAGGALPERAVVRDAPATAPASTGAVPIRRMLARLLDALGIACDTVYAGVNQTGRGLKRGYHVVHNAFAALGRSNAADAGGTPTAVGRKPYVPPPADDRTNVAVMAGVEAEIVHRALKRSTTAVDFTGDKLTYRNLFYLIRSRAYREQQDEAGLGLRSPASTDRDCLMRHVATAMNNSRDPFGMLSNGIEGGANASIFKPLTDTGESRFAAARAQYLAYRDEHYPDFDNRYRRLIQFGDRVTTSIVERTIEAHRVACEAQGIPFDEDAVIDGEMVLNPGDLYPVTARQFSEDLLRMRKCAAELATSLERRTSFQA
ncbi:hypothetical protein BOSP111201_20030 [Bordetella sputigena]|uniref:hypothetical protein n=1 Tax=Bordetella sputigena TaxID=1416810 RepID=UPI0039F12095